MFPPVLSVPEWVEFEGTAQCNDQQKAADQTADQSCCDHLPGHCCQAVPLIAPVQAVLLAVTPPRLKDAQVSPAVKVSRLAVVAVLLVRPIWTPLLVVAALRCWVAHSSTTLARKLSVRARRAGLLVAPWWAVPVAVAALAFRVAALIAATGTLARKTVTFDLEWRRRNTQLSSHCLVTEKACSLHLQNSLSVFQPYKSEPCWFSRKGGNGERKPQEDIWRHAYLVCGVEAVSRAVRLGHVQNTHLPSARLEQRWTPVVMIGQHL